MSEPLTEAEQLAVWAQWYPNRKIPGSYEPLEGKCGSRLIKKELRDLDLVRRCTQRSGAGTEHLGVGSCKAHLGNSVLHVRGAMRQIVKRELSELSISLGESEPLGPPEIEAAKLMAKFKTWSLILEQQMDELNGNWSTYDRADMEHQKVVVELMERSHDRLMRSLEFAMKFNLDQRVVALEEQQINLLGAGIMKVILSQELKLSEAQIGIFRTLFAQEMTRLGPSLVPTWSSAIRKVDDADIVDAEVVED